jgi:hypothetical protein
MKNKIEKWKLFSFFEEFFIPFFQKKFFFLRMKTLNKVTQSTFLEFLEKHALKFQCCSR